MNSQLHLLDVHLNQIAGGHEIVVKLREELGVFVSEPLVGQMTEAGLFGLARHCPIRITRKSDQYWCIAGFRIFRLLKAGLGGGAEIPVLFQKRIRVAALRESVLYELLVVPPIQALHPRDKKLMSRLWREQKDSDFFRNALRSTGSRALAYMLNCDPRTLEG